MGVHGLTTFIAYYQGRYKEKVFIRDRPVLIDGCNLMYYLYFDGKNSVVVRGPKKADPTSKNLPHAHLFCGDWEQYAQNVRYFFQQLKQCNIVPVVIFDGAYDVQKLEVARTRFAKSVSDNIKQGDGNGGVVYPGKAYTPIFLKTVFLEVLDEQKILHYQTVGEADSTIAFIARLLKNCPILSCDSDFYIYINAKMIPLPSLRFGKATPPGKNKSRGSGIDKSSKIWTLQGEFVSLDKLCSQEFKLKNTRLLGLAAVVVGNDIIQHRVFKNFQSGGGSMHLRARTCTVMHWLASQKTTDGAIHALVDFVPEEKRKFTEKAIRVNLKIYDGEDGEIEIWNRLKNDIDLTDFTDHDLEVKITECISELSIYEEANTSEIKSDLKTVNKSVCSELENSDLNTSDCNEDNIEDLLEQGMTNLTLDNAVFSKKVTTCHLPDWYVRGHISCQFQSYLLNILKNHIVFLMPQVEVYEAAGSHELSVPIIQVTAGILVPEPDSKIELVTRHKGTMYSQDIFPVVELQHYGKLPRIVLFNDNQVEPDIPFGELSMTISHENRAKILAATLGLYDSPVVANFSQGWPAAYRIWIATYMHYVKSFLSTTRMTVYERLSVLTSIFLCVIKNLIVNPGKITKGTSENPCLSAISALLSATEKDAVKLQNVRKFYKKFEDFSEVTGRKFMRAYDIRLSYCLSEYLNIVYHTEMLNNLLGNPFKSPKVRYNMNNFFVYNFANHIISGRFNTSEEEVIIDRSCVNDIADATGVEEIKNVLSEFLNVVCNVGSIPL